MHHTKTKEPHNEILSRKPPVIFQTSKAKNKQTKRTRTSCPLPHAFMEDTIRHNPAQMISTSKLNIPCLLVIIIKLCHMIT